MSFCRSEVYLKEPCDICQHPSLKCDDCIYCLEIQKEIRRREKRRAIQRVQAVLDGKTHKYIFTLSPGNVSYETFCGIIDNLKSKKWLFSCKIAYELTPEHSYPHAHGLMETTKKIQWNEVKQICGGTTQLNAAKGLALIKWKQYMEKKKRTEEVEYFFYRDNPLCDITLIDQLK